MVSVNHERSLRDSVAASACRALKSAAQRALLKYIQLRKSRSPLKSCGIEKKCVRFDMKSSEVIEIERFAFPEGYFITSMEVQIAMYENRLEQLIEEKEKLTQELHQRQYSQSFAITA